MSSGPQDTDDGRGDASTSTHIPADAGAPTDALVAGTVGDRCVNCGAPLSSDQRYCVNCGERRGAARFTLPAASSAADQQPPAAVPRREPRAPRFSSGATLVAGVGTLLLAMGVGVLIGHSSSNNAKTAAAAPTQVIRLGGSGSASGSSGASGSSAGSGSKSGSGAKSGSHARKASAKAKKPATRAVAKKQSNAAAKVLGASSKNVPPSTVTVGQSGSGPGFSKKTHKFNGSFFGQ